MPEYKMPELEEVICAAIVDRFFQPTVTGVTMQPGPWVNGAQQYVPAPTYGDAPLATVTRQMYFDNAHDLAKRIWDRLDVDALAERVAELCIEKLFAGKPTNWNGLGSEPGEVKALKEAVNKRLADELTRRALAKLDAADAGDEA